MDKVEEKGIKEMLEEKGIDGKVVELIKANSLTQIEKVIGSETVGIKEVKEFLQLCKENSLDFIEFDARLARGFEYYTGIVFEIKLDNGPSVGGGGRFDKLIGLYGGQETPAVGVGIGVSRIFDYLKETGFKVALDGLFLIGIGVKQKELTRVARVLREKGIFAEPDLTEKNVSRGIEYAEKKGYAFVGIIGENELKENKISVKNLSTGKQEEVSLKDLGKLFTLVQKK